ncbi:iron chelate uptake ABC transporter family permease subunit [Gottschalkia acidurici]|uniref:iron chelate uptake ABC transporter family permease subunit n=1 Tax=Clostridium acidurici TaxID=1556 RepID=UPI003B8380C4
MCCGCSSWKKHRICRINNATNSKKIFGEDYIKNIPLSFLLGAVLLVYSDIAARLIYSPYEVPIGIFTALIGVPFFIVVARKERG